MMRSIDETGHGRMICTKRQQLLQYHPAAEKTAERQVVAGEQSFPERPLLGLHISSGSCGREAPYIT